MIRELVVQIPHPDLVEGIDKPLFQQTGIDRHQDQHQVDHGRQQQQQQPPPPQHGLVYNLIVILLDMLGLAVHGLQATVTNYVEMIVWLCWLSLNVYFGVTKFLIQHSKHITLTFVVGVILTELLTFVMIWSEVHQVWSYVVLATKTTIKNDQVNDDDDDYNDDPTITTCTSPDETSFSFEDLVLFFISILVSLYIFTVWWNAFYLKVKRQTLLITDTRINKGLRILIFGFLFWKVNTYTFSTYIMSSTTADGSSPENEIDITMTTTMMKTVLMNPMSLRLAVETHSFIWPQRWIVSFTMSLFGCLWLELVYFVAQLLYKGYYVRTSERYIIQMADKLSLSELDEIIADEYDDRDEFDDVSPKVEHFIRQAHALRVEIHTTPTMSHVWMFRIIVIGSVYWEIVKTLFLVGSSNDDHDQDDNYIPQPTTTTPYDDYTMYDLVLVATITFGISLVVLYLFESY